MIYLTFTFANFIKIAPFFIFINIILKVFGVFDELYFTYESLLYGFLGNLAYSMWQVFQVLGDESEQVKPITKRRWIFLILRPFAAGLTSFVFSAIIVAVAGGLGENASEFIKGTGSSLLIGIFSGLFFDHLTNKHFLDTFFEKRIKNKVLGDE